MSINKNNLYKIVLFNVNYDLSASIPNNIEIDNYNKITDILPINYNILIIVNNDTHKNDHNEKILDTIRLEGIPIITDSDADNIIKKINYFYRIRNKMYQYDYSNKLKVQEKRMINILIAIVKNNSDEQFNFILKQLEEQTLDQQTNIYFRIYDNNINSLCVPSHSTHYYYYKKLTKKYNNDTMKRLLHYIYVDIYKNMKGIDFIFVLDDKYIYDDTFLQSCINCYVKNNDLNTIVFNLQEDTNNKVIKSTNFIANFMCNKKFFIKYHHINITNNNSLQEYNLAIYSSLDKIYNFYTLKNNSMKKFDLDNYLKNIKLEKIYNITALTKNIANKYVKNNNDNNNEYTRNILEVTTEHFNIHNNDRCICRIVDKNTTNIIGNIIIIETLFEKFLYDFNIKGFHSNRDATIYFVQNNKIEELKYSKLQNSLENNINFIDNYKYDVTHIIIKNDTLEELKIGSMSFEKLTFPIKRDVFERTIVKMDIKGTFKKNVDRLYNVAVIADIFTYDNLSESFNLFYIDVNNPIDIFINNIDFIFIESAWHGIDNMWRTKISNYNNGLEDMFEYAKNYNIPKVFYNKEDPIHFDKFITIAKKFTGSRDCILTTAKECVEKYKEYGCLNIIAYPFCCEPVKHNPINRIMNGSRIIFPGSYYYRFPDRCKDTDYILDTYYDNVEIYDRQYLFNKMYYQSTQMQNNSYKFPKKYLPLIKGSLTYDQIFTAFNNYQILINLNTVNTSETMFSRRVMEACATGLCIISNPSIGMTKIFGDNVIDYKDNKSITKLIGNDEYRQKIADNCYKTVMKKYTYKHLLNKMLNKIGMDKKFNMVNKKDILLLIFIEQNANINKFNHFINNYNYVIVTKNIIGSAEIEKHRKYKYYAIMNEHCIYGEDYIENMLIPTLYTDAHIIGKGAYYFNNNKLVNASLEHRFTNRLNINTIILKSTPQTKMLLNENILNSITEYINYEFNGTNMYSCDKYDFYDNQRNYHCIFNKDIEIRCINKIQESNKDTLKLIMCQWKRTDIIKKVLNKLNKQTDMNFELYIWNNSKINIDTECKGKFNIYIYDSENNIGGMGRFYLTHYLLKRDSFKYVIFFDDDQLLPDDFVTTCRQFKKEKTAYSWYGRVFYKDQPYTYVKKDNNQIIDYNRLKEFDYGGTGGMIVDTSVFSDDAFYFTMPKEYLFVEDLWLSYYSTINMNYKFLKLPVQIKNIKDGKDQYNSLIDLKNIMLEYCRNNGWNV